MRELKRRLQMDSMAGIAQWLGRRSRPDLITRCVLATDEHRIAVIGGGAFGTAFSNALARNPANQRLLYSTDPNGVASINEQLVNLRYFPNNLPDERLAATGDLTALRDSDWIFLAVPALAAAGLWCRMVTWAIPPTATLRPSPAPSSCSASRWTSRGSSG